MESAADEGDYQDLLWNGIVETVRKHDVNLLYHPLPMVGVAMMQMDLPTIAVDNRSCVSEAVAETIVGLGIDWSEVRTLSDLQTGLRRAGEWLDEQHQW